MNCPACQGRNPSNAQSCLHCGQPLVDDTPASHLAHDGADSNDDDSSSMSSLVTGLLIIGLIGFALANKDKIKEWFWTTESTSMRCFTPSEAMLRGPDLEKQGWTRTTAPTFGPDREKGKTACYTKNVGAWKDRVDDRFVPDEYKDGEKPKAQ